MGRMRLSKALRRNEAPLPHRICICADSIGGAAGDVMLRPGPLTCRHATALALVVWYLMIPPNKWTKDATGGVVTYPYWTWKRVKGCVTKPECEAAKNKMAKMTDDPKAAYVWQLADCISSDDPRLKDN
jgi:hypothetical protein